MGNLAKFNIYPNDYSSQYGHIDLDVRFSGSEVTFLGSVRISYGSDDV
jgi:hypothetical protein